jgi:hypothetical protein
MHYRLLNRVNQLGLISSANSILFFSEYEYVIATICFQQISQWRKKGKDKECKNMRLRLPFTASVAINNKIQSSCGNRQELKDKN